MRARPAGLRSTTWHRRVKHACAREAAMNNGAPCLGRAHSVTLSKNAGQVPADARRSEIG